MKQGLLTLDISFPIIVRIENDFSVMQNIQEYTTCLRSYIPALNILPESIIDANGIMYKRGEVIFLKYINAFKGFSIKYGGFGVSYVQKQLSKIKDLTVNELKDIGLDIIKSNQNFYSGTALDIQKWQDEFKILTDKENCLRYLFYFADTSRFYDPDKKDMNWRERVDFTK